MNDYAPRNRGSVETRLAVAEEQIRAFNLRLTSVSDRAYALTSSVESVHVVLKEAREQRSDLIDKVDDVQETIRALKDDSIRVGTEMAHHVRVCEARSSRLEKLAWTAISVMLTVMGFLATAYFTRIPH